MRRKGAGAQQRGTRLGHLGAQPLQSGARTPLQQHLRQRRRQHRQEAVLLLLAAAADLHLQVYRRGVRRKQPAALRHPAQRQRHRLPVCALPRAGMHPDRRLSRRVCPSGQTRRELSQAHVLHLVLPHHKAVAEGAPSRQCRRARQRDGLSALCRRNASGAEVRAASEGLEQHVPQRLRVGLHQQLRRLLHTLPHIHHRAAPSAALCALGREGCLPQRQRPRLQHLQPHQHLRAGRAALLARRQLARGAHGDLPPTVPHRGRDAGALQDGAGRLRRLHRPQTAPLRRRGCRRALLSAERGVPGFLRQDGATGRLDHRQRMLRRQPHPARRHADATRTDASRRHHTR